MAVRISVCATRTIQCSIQAIRVKVKKFYTLKDNALFASDNEMQRK